MMIPTDSTLYVGVMSGTSMDAVDTVLVDISQDGLNVIAQNTSNFPVSLKDKILLLANGGKVSAGEFGELDHQLGLLFAESVNDLLKNSGVSASAVRAIGCHGQTVFHHPSGEYPFTLQLGDANLIAATTAIDTIADFRRKDMALGGQGAPLVPAFHQHLFQQKDSVVVILNIGGMANITVLHPEKETIGYDTGPGNVLQDIWIQKVHGLPYDEHAALARQGRLRPELLHVFLQEDFFSRPPPKSTGREYFNLKWLEEKLMDFSHVHSADVQYNLLELTAQSIATEIHRYYDKNYRAQVYVCGGGARNPLLMQRLRLLLPQWEIGVTDDIGIEGDYLEAVAFAWLAYRHINGLSGNLPAVTGAKRETILGGFYSAR